MSYATRAELAQHGIGTGGLSGISTTDQDAALEAASDLADSYLAGRYTLPLTAWQTDLTRTVCVIATYDLLSVRGYNPDGDSDNNVRQRYLDALAWLERVAKGAISPVITDSAVSSSATVAPDIVTNVRRGW